MATDKARAERIPLLDQASPSTNDRLGRHLRVCDVPCGTVLARCDMAPQHLYFLLDGYVGSSACDCRANDYVVAFFGPGDAFFLCSVLLDLPYPLTLSVLQDSRVAMLPAREFRDCLEIDGSLALAAARSLAAQRRSLAIQIRDSHLRRPTERLAEFVAGLISDKAGDHARVTLPCDRRILAGWLGLVPASISRAFRELSRIGVHGRGRDLTITSVEALRAFARLRPHGSRVERVF